MNTAWVNYPDLFTVQCLNTDGASRLQITDIRKPGDDRPKLIDALGPTWGLHIYDGNIARVPGRHCAVGGRSVRREGLIRGLRETRIS